MPTPSVPETSSRSPRSNSPAKPPCDSTTPGRRVERTAAASRPTIASAASSETPAAAYVTAPSSDGRGLEAPKPAALAQLVGDRRRVVPVRQARQKRFGGAGRRGLQAVEREVGERVGAERRRGSPRRSRWRRSARRRRPCRCRSSRATRSAATRCAGAPRRRRPRAASRRSCAWSCRGRSSRRRPRRACPAMLSGSGLNFSLTPCSRSPWSGWMNVRPT